MLYVCSLSVMAKKALGNDKAFTAPLSKVLSQLPLDPKTTNMDSVLFGPADMAGVNKTKVLKAIGAGVHPDICLMFLYTKESEAKDVSIPYMKGVRKINSDEINKFVSDSMNDFLENSGKLNADIDALANAEEISITPKEEKEDIKAEIKEDTTSVIPEETPLPKVEVPVVNLNKEDVNQEIPIADEVKSVEQPVDRKEMLQNIKNYEDWDLLREAMERDNITKQLIQENTEYAGAVQMLSVLDNKIKTIWMDSSLSSEKKLEQITQIGLEKSTLRSASNSIMVSKVIDIIETSAMCAKRVVDETVESVNEALAKITTDSKAMIDDQVFVKANQDRIDIQLKLQDMIMSLNKLYGDMDTVTTETVSGLGEKLPSDNEFINNMLPPNAANIFTPHNTSQLANKLLTKLRDNTVTMSALEDKIQNIIRLVYTMFDQDQKQLKYYEDLTNMLKANRVEDVIVRDTVLKYVLNVYIGADDTGRTATALTRSGVQSRANNTLLIDISGTPHFDRYGVDAVPLSEFLVTRTEKHLLCVQSERKLDSDEIQRMLSELRSRLNYYSIINIIVKPDDRQALSMLAPEALSFNYITDCRGRSIDAIKDCMADTAYSNIAKKLIEIDAPISPLQIAEAVGADFTQIKLVPLPNMKDIRACALKHDRPYEYSSVAAVFEEVFR